MSTVASRFPDELPLEIARKIFQSAREAGHDALDESAGKQVLSAFGVPIPASRVANTPDEAASLAAGLKPPFVVKVLCSQAVHKSDLGGVRLGLTNADQVRGAAEDILSGWPSRAPAIDGFLVEEMVSAGQEVVIGGFRDPQFGPLIMVGLGGVFVEIFADVAFRVCPITPSDAEAMLDELKGKPLLDGARGGILADKEALIDLMLRIGGDGGLLAALGDEISELDINPVIVGADGAVAVDARFILTEKDAFGPSSETGMPESFEPLFRPRTVAVAGVSSSGNGPGNRFIQNIRKLGFDGEIYPIHPTAEMLEGLPAYRCFSKTPKSVDYAYVAIPKAGVSDLLASAGGRVKFAQVMTSGFGEGGKNEAGEQSLLQASRKGGVRLLGPNSLGTYSPAGKITFAEPQMEAVAGSIGIVSQSGGIGVDFLRTGQAKGLRYSGVVTVGNCADLGPNDFLEHFLDDDATSVIGMYLEDIGDGRRFASLLQKARGRKPIVLLKGGRTAQGQKAVMSHTGALSGDGRVWAALSAQTGCILVDTIEELLDVLLMFQTITPASGRVSRKFALFGNGGGASVVATDCMVTHGFDLAEFSGKLEEGMGKLELPDGASIQNPIDFPANAFNKSNGEVADGILGELYRANEVDVILLHLNMPVLVSYRESRIIPNIVDAAIANRRSAAKESPHLVMVLRSDGTDEVERLKRSESQRAAEAGIPVFDNFAVATRAIGALARFEAFREVRNARN